MHKLEVITPPTSPRAISLEFAKRAARIDFDDEDALHDTFLAAAQSWCENWTGIKFVEQQVRWSGRCFPVGSTLFPVPAGNVTSVDAISYDDDSGAQMFTAFSVDLSDRTPIIYPDEEWPSTNRLFGSARVDLTVGWPVDEVPADVQLAIAGLFKHYDDNRSLESDAPSHVTALLSEHRISFVG